VFRRFDDRDQNFSAGNAGNLLGKLTGLMRSMRKLKAEHVPPERQRSLEIRDRDAGVIGGENPERHEKENVQRRTPNVQCRIRKLLFGVILGNASRITLVTDSSNAYIFGSYGADS
jgi:hypothetical protein